MKKIIFLLLLFNTLFFSSAQTTFTVNSQISFDDAENMANSGDIIEWTDGTYADIYMQIDTDGITVQSETPGGVTFNGSSRARVNGDNVTFTGFQYIGGDILDLITPVDDLEVIPQTIITIDGSNVNISDINMSQYSCWKYMRIRNVSQYTTVSYCNFENRLNYADQNIFQIDAAELQSGFHTISYCSFKNFTGEPGSTGGDDGVEPIRTGSSSQSLYSSKTTIEYCYFTGCNGDDEVISGKASDCIYRYNTLESNTGEIVLRHGNRALVYGNFFINNESGVRVREGSEHIIYNNYFSGLTAESIYLQASINPVRVENVIVAHNTFASTDRVRLGDEDMVNDPLNTVFINNIFDSTTSTSQFEDETGTETFTGNIINNFIDLGLAATNGFTEVDPQLTVNSEGYYQLASTSPAIDASVDDTNIFPFPLVSGLDSDNEILLDVISQARPSTVNLKDVGCQEYSATAVVEPYVNEENTGPSYLMDNPVLSVNNFENELNSTVSIFPNPTVGNSVNFKLSNPINALLEITIFDISGKKIASIDKIDKTELKLDFPIELNSGLYVVQISAFNPNGKFIASTTQKLIKY